MSRWGERQYCRTVDELLTVAEVAERLKLNQQTVRNWIDEERLPALRIGPRRVRVKAGDLEAFVSSGATTNRPPSADASDAAEPTLSVSIDGDVIRVEVPGLTSEERHRLAAVLRAVAAALAKD